jgi:hypothetical protein
MNTDEHRFVGCKRTQNTHNRFRFDCFSPIEEGGHRPGEGIRHGQGGVSFHFLYVASPEIMAAGQASPQHPCIDHSPNIANCAIMSQKRIAWIKTDFFG